MTDARREMFAGDATWDSDGTFAGVVGGSLSVAPGVRLTLTGMVRGDLIIGAGAEVDHRGMIGGRVINQGGRLTGAGMVGG